MKKFVNAFLIALTAVLVLGASSCESDYSDYSSPEPTYESETSGESYGSYSEPEPEPPQEECVIKGNISYNTGEKIYHVPGQQYYDATSIDTSAGEMMFCSEEEAVNAGWRRSKL